jgi:hypothetical protein
VTFRAARENVRYFGFLVLGSALVGLLVLTVVNAMVRADRAETARAQTARSASRRIDLLNARITELQAQAVDNGQTIAGLATDVEALTAQLREAGKTPVVTPTTRPSVTATTVRRPASSTTTTAAPASPSTTSTTAAPAPPATTTTTRPCNVHIPNDGCALP